MARSSVTGADGAGTASQDAAAEGEVGAWTERKTVGAAKGRPYEMIRQAIRTGVYQPSQHLTETALADWCGVSRTPVREALTRLQQEGLVVRTEHGVMVRARTLEELYNIFEVRVVLEEKAARAAAERRTDRDLFVLRAAVEQYERGVLAPDPAVVASAMSFHRAVWRAARNDTLFDLLVQLDMQIPPYSDEAMSSAEVRERSSGYHRDLFDAIEASDPERAASVAAAHFIEERDIRLRYFSTHDDTVRSAGE
jgi:DNA-binding GntR family transcriptional regulator